MFTLADLLNPSPSQKERAPDAMMVEADASAKPDQNTANEQILSNDAKSPKHSAQTKKSASLIGSAVSSKTESSSAPALPSDVNTLAGLSQHELSPSKQPRADKSIARSKIYYDGRKWEYKGYKWVKQGILSLKLMPVGSNEIIELVHERDVQLDNQKGLLKLWKGIRRPKPKNRMYQPLKILGETEDEKFETQWTGFDEESYSLEPASKMRKVAPDLVEEYYARQKQGEASHAVKRGGKSPLRRPQLPPGPRRKHAHRPRRRPDPLEYAAVKVIFVWAPSAPKQAMVTMYLLIESPGSARSSGPGAFTPWQKMPP
ncbi:Chromo domain/shadow [Cordyceps fumosorosea ARSEF 2679]|uniref:Chromo domain/shadow n=1 Tax=Cordyceps fumosorosea (strain ARSEF 2679) TaxID=1081104 RepID=A0A162JJ49_CORFA|nr:Chromo domain/shadow [Cordyceps fumosorosea ARSEF 2679]OAA42783.1 Chromo domain/shadow [Cordyceps fumosorosea ARSEF 2679]